jgi:hypothetical protein
MRTQGTLNERWLTALRRLPSQMEGWIYKTMKTTEDTNPDAKRT